MGYIEQFYTWSTANVLTAARLNGNVSAIIDGLDAGSKDINIAKLKISGSDVIDSSQNITNTGDITNSSATSAKPVLTIKNTNADANSSELQFYKLSASPADNDNVGVINFYGNDDAENKTLFGKILVESTDVTNGTEDAKITLYSMKAGTSTASLTISSGAVTCNVSLDIAGSGATVTGILDEDDMSSNSAVKLATQQSIKAYVDTAILTTDTWQEVMTNGNTFYAASNDGNPQMRMGATDAEELHIQCVYDSGAQTLDYVIFQTDAASGTADKGEFRFNVDGTLVATLDDGGLEVKASGSISFGAVDILTDSSGTTTLNNIDVLDATTEATIESAIDTLANLTAASALVTVGALNSGSITSGFGNIDNGSSTLDTGIATVASMVCTAGATFGGGYGSTGVSISTAGVIQANGNIETSSSFVIGSASMDETDLEKLDGITNGTAAANKAVVLEGSKNIATLGTVGCGAITSTGTSAFGDVTIGGGYGSTGVTVSAAGVIQANGNIETASSFVIGSASMDETDLEKLDGITNGTAAANKAVVLEGSKNIATLGTVGCGAITSTGDSTFDSTTLVIDSSNNRVGVGIGSPTVSLDVTKSGSSNYINVSDGTVFNYFGVSNSGVIATVGTVTNHPIRFDTNNTERMRITNAGLVLINDSANANSTVGLTINQAANDDEILSFKSSDVNHGVTGVTETDTWGFFKKNSGNSGGLFASFLSDATEPVLIQAIETTTTSTAKSTSASGAISLRAGKANGTAVGNLDSNANIFTLRAFKGGAFATVFIVDEDGDLYADGGTATTDMVTLYDEFSDAELIRTLEIARSENGAKGFVRSAHDDFIKYNEETLVHAGILGGKIKDGGMLNVTGLQRLHSGAIWQIYQENQMLKKSLKSIESHTNKIEKKLELLDLKV